MERYWHRKYTRNHLHRSHDFRRKSNKKFLIGIIVIILLAFIFAYDVANIKTSVQEGIVKIKSGSTTLNSKNAGFISNYCEENIIPNNFTFYKEQIISGVNEEALKSGVLQLLDPVWKDNRPIGKSPEGIPFMNPYNCKRGENEGENINYLYCKNVGYSNQDKKMDSEGNILKIENINYRIDLVIDMENPLGKRALTKINMWGGIVDMGELSYNKIANYECKRVDN